MAVLNTNFLPSQIQKDDRSFPLKIIHFIESIYRQAIFSATFFYNRQFSSTSQTYGQAIIWKKESQGLVVLVHGLRSDPAAWVSQLSILKQHHNLDIYIPVVPKKGLCSLQEAVEPIFAKLKNYTNKNPQKPICILGHSNGSRLATWIETELRKTSPDTPVMVSTIAGVHLGSSRMNLLEKLYLARWFYPSSLVDELRYGSLKAQELFHRMIMPMPSNCAKRKYEFYASTEDLSIPDLNSSLPHLGIGEETFLFHGHSHDSLLTAVSKDQIDSCITWIEEMSKK